MKSWIKAAIAVPLFILYFLLGGMLIASGIVVTLTAAIMNKLGKLIDILSP